MPRTYKPVPDDFGFIAGSMTRTQLMKHYRCAYVQIAHWVKVTGIKTRPVGLDQRHPVPDGFIENAQRMTRNGLQSHYGGGLAKIDRWLAETGVSALKVGQKARDKVKAKSKSEGPVSFLVRQDHRARSIYEDAADTLRRERWVVYRANEKGLADTKGKFWRVGNTVLTPDELLAKAARYEKRAA